MNKKILYIIVAIVFIISLIITAVAGLNVDLSYAEGNEVAFSLDKTIQIKDIKKITDEIWKKSNVEKIEYFDNSVLIKVKEVKEEEINILCNKINEKYETEIKAEDITIMHTSNIKLRDVIQPYIVPVILSTLLIVGFYAIKYKNTKKMIDLFKYLIISEAILYSIYAIARVPVNELTMPIAMIVYTIVVFMNTTIFKNIKKY